MLDKLTLKNIGFFIMLLMVLSLPFGSAFLSILTILLAIVATITVIHEKRIKHKEFVFLFFLLTLLLFLSYFWSANKVVALKHLPLRLSLLIPVFALQVELTDSDIKKIHKAHIVNIVLVCLLCFFYSLFESEGRSFTNLFSNHFLYRNAVFTRQTFPKVLGLHPVYLSIFIALASLMYTHSFLKGRHFINIKSTLVYILANCLLLFSMIVLSSRTTMAIFVLLLPSIPLLMNGIRPWFKYIFITVLLVITLIAANTSQIKYRLAKVNDKDLAIKLNTWSSSLNVFKKNPIIGTGIGDTGDELLKEYKKIDFEYGLKRKLNAHNDYIQILITCGILGLIIFLSIWYKAILLAIKRRDLVFILVLILFLTSMLTESFLSRHKGIGLITIFYSLFILKNDKLTQDG